MYFFLHYVVIVLGQRHAVFAGELILAERIRVNSELFSSH